MRASSEGLWLGISQSLHPHILPRVSTLRTTDEFVSQIPHATEKSQYIIAEGQIEERRGPQ